MSSLLADVSINLPEFISQNVLVAYLLIYVGAIFFGNVTAFSGLWFAFQGSFGRMGVLFVFLVLFVADITADFLWYTLGRSLSHTRFGNFVRRHIPHMERFDAHIHRNTGKWIFFSKFLYAASFPILFAVGWAKIDFGKYFRTSLLAAASWIPLITMLTLIFFKSTHFVPADLLASRIGIVFSIALVGFIILNALIRLFVTKVVGKKEI